MSPKPQMCCFKCGSSLFDSRQRLQSVSGASAGGTSARSFSVLISPALFFSLFLSFCLFSLSFASNPVKIFFLNPHIGWLKVCHRVLQLNQFQHVSAGSDGKSILDGFWDDSWTCFFFFLSPYMSWDCFILGNRIRHTSILILR